MTTIIETMSMEAGAVGSSCGAAQFSGTPSFIDANGLERAIGKLGKSDYGRYLRNILTNG